MNDISQHPTAAQLRAFGLGQLSPAEQARVERHVAECPSCCEALARVPDDTLLDRLRSTETADAWATVPAQSALAGVPAELCDHPRYRIVKVLGSGGMGTVFQAEHRLMERPVALKVIHRSLTGNADAVARFRQEVRAAARLAHPNIVAAYDAEQAGDVHFLVMEFVEGTSLARHVEQHGPLSAAEACDYVRQAALGLQHAFEQGMVHRDVKPQNLMRTPRGQIKILDFGLARLAREGRRLTRVGAVLGTPDYIAPEQAQDARHADIRADVYSLGCTLYFLLAGKPPFPTGSARTKLSSQLELTPPPLAADRPDLAPGLCAVLDRLMAKDPARRYATPAEAARALAPFTREAPAPPRQTPRRSRRLLLPLLAAALAGLMLLGLVGGVGLLLAYRFGLGGAKEVAAPPVTTQPRVLFLLAAENFHNPDYAPVRAVLESDGKIAVKVASTARRARPDAKGGGQPVDVDLLLSEAQAADFDALVICGGMGVGEFLVKEPGATTVPWLAREMLNRNKFVTALSLGSGVLAKTEILRGWKATGYSPMVQDKLREYGATVVDQPVVVSGPGDRIITARDPQAATEFAQTLRKALLERAP